MPRGIGRNRLRLVKRPTMSGPAATMLEGAAVHVDSETKASPMVGCVILSVYKNGAVNKSVHVPNPENGDGMGRDLFQVLMHQALDNIIVNRIADDQACSRVNAANGYDDAE